MIDFEKLKEPFHASDIEWRIQSSGKNQNGIWARVLAYINNRAIMDRLDSVVGPANWRNEYTKAPDGGVMCGLSIRIDSEWVTKWDGAENTDIEGVKGGLSSAMKRAGVQWGIGRYLYKLEAKYAKICDNGCERGQLKDKTPFNWDPPQLPAWAIPNGGVQEPKEKPLPQNVNQEQQKPVQDGKGVADAVKRCGELSKQLGITDVDKKALMSKHKNNFIAVARELEQMLAARQELDTAADAAFGSKEEQIQELFNAGN